MSVYEDAQLLCYKVDEMLNFKSNNLTPDQIVLLDQCCNIIKDIIGCKSDWVHIESQYMDWEKTSSYLSGHNEAISKVVDLIKDQVSESTITEIENLKHGAEEWGAG